MRSDSPASATMRSISALRCVSREMPAAVLRICAAPSTVIVLEAISRFLCLSPAGEGQFSALGADGWRLHGDLWK